MTFASAVGMKLALLALCDAITVVVCGVVAKIVYIDISLGQPQDYWFHLIPPLMLTFILYLFFKQMRLYEVDTLIQPAVGFGKIWGALAMSFLVLLGMLYLFKMAESYSRGWVLCWFALSALSLVAVRWTAGRHLRRQFVDGRLRRQIALYGTRDHVEQVRAHIEEACPETKVGGCYLIDYGVTDAGTAAGGLDDLKAAMAKGVYEKVVLALPGSDGEAIRSALQGLLSFSTEILLCSDLRHLAVRVHGLRTLGRLRAEVVSPVPASEHDLLLKRLLDYSVATIGLVLLAPVFAVVALLIKLDTPGPVFFLQRRYGRHNRVFRVFKFRTMVVREDGDAVKQAERQDPRVTRVGRFLRASSIDELPQLINVLLGEMSIVGPRPHALAHDDLFEKSLDQFSTRRKVLPGLTGWAQVNGYRGETRTMSDVRNRMEYDLEYIDRWSIWFDLEIMVRTVVTLVRGAY